MKREVRTENFMMGESVTLRGRPNVPRFYIAF